jgi:hypothetical protein
MVYSDIRVTALCNEDMQEFYRLLQTIQSLGVMGANRKIDLSVDGDGSGRYGFYWIENSPLKSKTKPFPPPKQFDPDNLQPIYLGE